MGKVNPFQANVPLYTPLKQKKTSGNFMLSGSIEKICITQYICIANVPFLYPVKEAENLWFLVLLGGVEKDNILK